MSERLVKKANIVGRGSLSIVVPKRWADALGIKPGDRVLLHFDGSKITVSPTASSEQNEEVNVLVELDSSSIAIRKLVASYVEGVTRVKLKAEYEHVLKLSEELKNYVTSFILIANPDLDTHELAFSDVKTDLVSLLKTMEATSSKLVENIEERDPSALVTYREFYRKYLYFLRSLKQSVADGSLDSYEALDLAVSIEYVKEIFDLLITADQSKLSSDSNLLRILEIARAAISATLLQDVEVAVNNVIKILNLLEEVNCASEICRSVKYLATRISELVLGRCVRNRACRCKYFFPKV
ncbi:MAG: AbrB/MazE/SpoVT family DNA-binding domain-containing protein [Sulfolobales archaeon]|nr:AbrB/MazE/SpoVT family DNA-binding domain-containing protein [Sulfolobales archaeon]MDW8082330.1 AbrB/MazE/SpoVT family DNA-binding domain-containing protein [Sulfolobales archaeon]